MPDSRPKSPVTVYVLWHPRCEDGPGLAGAIYAWLRVGYADQPGNGAGVPVYYRSAPYEAGGSLPRDITVGDTALNVIVPLVDEHAVADREWRAWLERWATRVDSPAERDQLLLLPVELHSSLARLPKLSATSAIRVRKSDDAVLRPEERRTRWARRLRRHLTQAMLHRLLERADAGIRKTLGRSVFLSHAKADEADGVGIAEQIRVAALSLGQVETFYDASSLEWGKGWKAPMLGAAARETGALIAIVSDSYASRYWCRQEVKLARQPRRANPKDRSGRVWWVQPAVCVSSLDSVWTRQVPELAGVPTMAWDGEGSAEDVLDRAVLEALLTEVHIRYAQEIDSWIVEAGAWAGVPRPDHYLTWAPDPYTLATWRQTLADEGVRSGTVGYPAHALSAIDEDVAHESAGPFTLISLDDLHLGADIPPPGALADSDARLIVSGGVPGVEDLARMGVGPEHLTEAFYRVARAALVSGVGIAYGGAQSGEQGPRLLAALVDAAMGARHARSSTQNRVRAAEPTAPAIVNFLGWFPDGGISTAEEADLVGLVDVRRVSLADLGEAKAPDEALLPWVKAKGLWKMRERMADDCQGLVVMGGKTYNFYSYAPGCLEEAAAMVARRRPVWVFRGLGGTALRLAEWLLAEGDAPLELLDLDRALALPENERLQATFRAAETGLGAGAARDHIEAHYRYLAGKLDELRRDVRGGGEIGGMSHTEYVDLLKTESVRHLRLQMLLRVVPSVRMGGGAT